MKAINFKKYIAECIGTFAMVFCGTAAMVVNEVTKGAVGHVGIAISWGLVVMAMIYTFARHSGAHFNPAVSIALVLARLFPLKELPQYVFAQCIGAILASALLLYIFPDSTLLGGTHPTIAVHKAFLVEFLLTFFLMLVILSCSTGPKETQAFAGIVIGAVVLLEALFAGPITNASMNPARSLGPAVCSGLWNKQWLYFVAPTLGAIFSSLVYRIWSK